MPRKKQKQSKKVSKQSPKKFLRLFAYLPLVAAILASIFLSGWSPKTQVLSYATNVTTGGLLSATNSQRVANGVGSLALNAQLNSAAQAKANDMVNRNYWSHNTPDGQEPWVFISTSGYQYLSAGENLAYGFSDSDSTITGWMNSPPHKENLLNGTFSEVGFGYADSANFVGSGPETVVVAMYGKPKVLAVSNQSAPSSSVRASTPAPTPAPEPEPAPVPATVTTETDKKSDQPVATTNTSKTEPTTKAVTKAEALTSSSKPWASFAIGATIGLCIVAMFIKHGYYLRQYLSKGERFILHHPWFDSTILGLLLLAITLSQTAGFIK